MNFQVVLSPGFLIGEECSLVLKWQVTLGKAKILESTKAYVDKWIQFFSALVSVEVFII